VTESDFKKITGWIDYDRNDLVKLNKLQKIQYFYDKRVKMILLNPLKLMYKEIMKENKRCSPLLCFGNCICCSIEAFGKFYTGRTQGQNSGKNFRGFIKQYMDSSYFIQRYNSEKYVNILWEDFRNGIAHGFAIKRGGFQHNLKSYFQIINKQLEIEPTLFYHDFLRGVKKYIEDLESSQDTDKIYRNFNKTFTDIYIRGK